MTRRGFLQTTAAALSAASCVTAAEPATKRSSAAKLGDRVAGLLIGTLLGDTLGGPIEFQEPQRVHALPDPPKTWAQAEVLDDAAIAQAAARLQLRSYRDLRPVPEPYAHWSHNAEPGTITDDSRHKLILLHALRQAHRAANWPISEVELAQAYLDWPHSGTIRDRDDYSEICAEWLHEIQLSARWVLGERDPEKARPTERLWNGLPTCCGQMAFPPLAAIFPGDPTSAYLSAYSLAFIDNGWGRDMNAALVAGLATALTVDVDAARPELAWQKVFAAMRATDPFAYGKVPWTYRSVDRWLDFALGAASEAGRQPAKLFARLNDEFRDTIKWEAQVPFAVVFASLAICNYQPLAALQLSIEWGHDTDSYAQLLGAFVGALHGAEIFPAEMRSTVARRLQSDYGEDLNEWEKLLADVRNLAKQQTLFHSR